MSDHVCTDCGTPYYVDIEEPCVLCGGKVIEDPPLRRIDGEET